MNQDERRAPVPRTVTGKIDDSVNGKQESEADPAIEGLIEAEDQEQPRGETLSLIMSLYFGPLLAYARRIARREPIELVCDFFAERVARAEYLRSWRSSGLRLRSWLMNGLWFYAREVRSSRRATLGLAAAADVPALALDPGRAMEEAFARRLVQRALDIAGNGDQESIELAAQAT